MDNQWRQIVMTYDGTNLKLYINGVLMESKYYDQSKQIKHTEERISIVSGYPDSDSGYQGEIDEVKIYNRA